jgi:hypothetical protein
MTFDEFINKIVPKVGPNNTFSLARDIEANTLREILIKKNIFTKEEFDLEFSNALSKTAGEILNMPPLPNKKDGKND